VKFRLTEPAAYDIRRITDHIASDDPVGAELIAKKFQSALRAIGNTPFLYPRVPRSRWRALRKNSVKPYVILFEVVGKEARILRVAHERSDWTSLV
jgi:plasmid stabilization system protein ParE